MELDWNWTHVAGTVVLVLLWFSGWIGIRIERYARTGRIRRRRIQDILDESTGIDKTPKT